MLEYQTASLLEQLLALAKGKAPAGFPFSFFLMTKMKEVWNSHHPYEVTCSSSLPIHAGLGSSGAFCSVVAAFYLYLGREIVDSALSASDHLELCRLGVSNALLDEIVRRTVVLGFGAKLTGAGSGGCVIATKSGELDATDSDEENVKVTQITEIPSKLETRVQALINFLFDTDLCKMPLGKIFRVQIQEAYSVLSDLSILLSSNKALQRPAKSKLIGDTTRFYTPIPHDFEVTMPFLLDNLEVTKSKPRMLEGLLKIEVAYSLMKNGNSDANPID
nr:hypothetical transcript [Hymenolepis microstoma]